MTAKEWRDANPNLKGNIRDYADISQLLVLANLESYNAILIEQGMEQDKRIVLLRQTAINQLNTIAGLETSLTGVQDVLIRAGWIPCSDFEYFCTLITHRIKRRG